MLIGACSPNYHLVQSSASKLLKHFKLYSLNTPRLQKTEIQLDNAARPVQYWVLCNACSCMARTTGFSVYAAMCTITKYKLSPFYGCHDVVHSPPFVSIDSSAFAFPLLRLSINLVGGGGSLILVAVAGTTSIL